MPVAPLRNANREPHWVMAYSVKTTNLHDHFPPVLRAASTADQDVRADVPEHKESPLQSLNPSPLSTMLLRSLFHANCCFLFSYFSLSFFVYHCRFRGRLWRECCVGGIPRWALQTKPYYVLFCKP